VKQDAIAEGREPRAESKRLFDFGFRIAHKKQEVESIECSSEIIKIKNSMPYAPCSMQIRD
jgi:hypothetical protein